MRVKNKNTKKSDALKILASEEIFIKAFRCNPNIIAISTLNEGRYLEVNEAMLRISGYSRKELIGRTSLEVGFFADPNDRDRIKKLLEKKGSIIKEYFVLRMKSGQLRDTLLSSEIININNEKCIITTIEDITDRKQTEDFIRIQHELAISLNTAKGVKDALVQMLNALFQVTGIDAGAMYQVDTNTGAVDLIISKGLSDEFVKLSSHYDKESYNAKIIHDGKPIFVPYKQFPVDMNDIRQRENITFLAVIPIKHENKVLGCMNIASHSLMDFSDAYRNFLETIASQAGTIILRLKLEEELRFSEEKFSKAFNSVPFLLTITRLSDGKIIEVNDAFLKKTGYSRDDIMGKTSIELDLYNKSEGRRQFTMLLDESDIFTDLELDIRTKSGELRNLLFFAIIILINNNKYLLSVGEDITERNQMLDLMQRQHELSLTLSSTTELKNALLNVVEDSEKLQGVDSVGIYLKDKFTNAFDLLCHKSIPADFIDKGSHYDKDSYNVKMISRGKPLYLHGEDLNFYIDSSHANNISFAAFIPIIHKAEVIGSLNVASHSVNEISDMSKSYLETLGPQIGGAIARIKAEDELKHLRNILTSIINSMPSVIIGIDSNMRITHWNTQSEKFTNINHRDAVGKLLLDVYPGFSVMMDIFEKSLTEKVNTKYEKFLITIGDKKYYWDIVIYPLVSELNEGIVIRIDDITQRIAYEEIIIQSEKMLSVGGLAAGLAHEINNPLASIIQNAQVMKRRLFEEIPANKEAADEADIKLDALSTYLEKREIKRMISGIEQSTLRASKIVESMLNFSHKSRGEFTMTKLTQLMDDTVDLISNEYYINNKYNMQKITIKREYNQSLPEIACDATKIQQVFVNIINNCVQAISEKLYINESPCLTLRLSKEKNMARIEIEDNGQGMDELTRRRIFEPFFTTRKVGDGTGLGMSVSYFIIKENHKGSMAIESSLGVGSKFIILLPYNDFVA